ncbi:MAG: redoxin domain-containing protein, partial [Thermicanus sp.]|nr:redoxin domain-containing protein [Thermicanus sp.]
QGLAIIGVNTGESVVTIQGYVNRLRVTYPIGMDPNYEVTNLYKTDPLPRTIFIDPEGKVKNVILGEMKESTIEENIAQILPK